MKRVLIPILFVLSIAWGCATMPSQSEIEADRGPYPTDYQTIIKAYYRGFLFNPDSALYEISQPIGVCYREEPLEGGRLLGGF